MKRISPTAADLGVPRVAWTVAELASAMGIKDPVTIRNWIHEGRVAAIKVGKTYRSPESERLRLERAAEAEAAARRAAS